MRKSSVVTLRALLACSMVVVSGQLAAQQVTFVTVISKANLPRGAAVVVIVRPKAIGNPQVLLDTDRATPEDLELALRGVRQAVATFADTLHGQVALYPKASARRETKASPQMSSHLRRLAKSKPSDLPGHGKVRSMDIVLGGEGSR